MNNEITREYDALCDKWGDSSETQRSVQLDRFKVSYSYNSGALENPEITYHDTSEVFTKNAVSNFTGDVRTIYEINNLKNSWEQLISSLGKTCPIDIPFILEVHRILTAGTYDEKRWRQGERPGAFKIHDYRVADEVGLEPELVREAVAELSKEIGEAINASLSADARLTIAAYAHARLVEIHPFADGNGRTARFLMNYLLMRLGSPPCVIDADDRMSYFGALDAFHQDGDIVPFKVFLMVETIKAWGSLDED